MKCFNEIILSFYVDGELDAGTHLAVATHLNFCQKCRRKVELLQQEGAILRKALALKTDETDISHRIMERIEHDDSIKKPLVMPEMSYRWVLTIAASFLVFMFLTLYLVLNPLRNDAQDSQIVIRSAQVEGRCVTPFIYNTSDDEVQYIWFENCSEKESFNVSPI